MMPQLVIVADDLTGAADTAGPFARHGASVAITLADQRIDADVIAVSTDSRDLSSQIAVSLVARKTGQLLAGCDDPAQTWLFKKIDSALRGNPVSEVLAVAAASGRTKILVAPAIPAQGRTTVNGQQLANGLPLQESGFGDDVAQSDLVIMFGESSPGTEIKKLDLDLIRLGPARIALHLSNLYCRLDKHILIADAETDQDLQYLAEAVAQAGPGWLLAGAAGFGSALADALPLQPQTGTPNFRSPLRQTLLVVAGTRHHTTARQVAALKREGVAIFRPGSDLFATTEDQQCILVAQLVHLMESGEDAVLTTLGSEPVSGASRDIAQRVAALAVAACRECEPGGLVLTGGDIAQAFLTLGGATSLWLTGEVEPAIPICLIGGGEFAGIPLVTKAGSFGSDQTLVNALEALHALRAA